jgi:hypothetical protein
MLRDLLLVKINLFLRTLLQDEFQLRMHADMRNGNEGPTNTDRTSSEHTTRNEKFWKRLLRGTRKVFQDSSRTQTEPSKCA